MVGKGKSVFKDYARTAISFGLVGFINTGVDFGAFVVLHNGLRVFYLLAQVLSYLAGTANSYFLNRLWTFKTERKASGGQALRFITINTISLAVSFYGIYVLNHIHVGLLGSKLLATIGGVLINFMGNRFWVFATSVG